LHDPQRQRGINEAQFVHRLLDEFIAVGQDEGPAPSPLDQEGKDNGLARPCGQHEQGPVDPTRGGGEEGGHRLILVRPGRQTQGRGGSDGTHYMASCDPERACSRRGAWGTAWSPPRPWGNLAPSHAGLSSCCLLWRDQAVSPLRVQVVVPRRPAPLT